MARKVERDGETIWIEPGFAESDASHCWRVKKDKTTDKHFYVNVGTKEKKWKLGFETTTTATGPASPEKKDKKEKAEKKDKAEKKSKKEGDGAASPEPDGTSKSPKKKSKAAVAGDGDATGGKADNVASDDGGGKKKDKKKKKQQATSSAESAVASAESGSPPVKGKPDAAGSPTASPKESPSKSKKKDRRNTASSAEDATAAQLSSPAAAAAKKPSKVIALEGDPPASSPGSPTSGKKGKKEKQPGTDATASNSSEAPVSPLSPKQKKDKKRDAKEEQAAASRAFLDSLGLGDSEPAAAPASPSAHARPVPWGSSNGASSPHGAAPTVRPKVDFFSAAHAGPLSGMPSSSSPTAPPDTSGLLALLKASTVSSGAEKGKSPPPVLAVVAPLAASTGVTPDSRPPVSQLDLMARRPMTTDRLPLSAPLSADDTAEPTATGTMDGKPSPPQRLAVVGGGAGEGALAKTDRPSVMVTPSATRLPQARSSPSVVSELPLRGMQAAATPPPPVSRASAPSSTPPSTDTTTTTPAVASVVVAPRTSSAVPPPVIASRDDATVISAGQRHDVNSPAELTRLNTSRQPHPDGGASAASREDAQSDRRSSTVTEPAAAPALFNAVARPEPLVVVNATAAVGVPTPVDVIHTTASSSSDMKKPLVTNVPSPLGRFMTTSFEVPGAVDVATPTHAPVTASAYHRSDDYSVNMPPSHPTPASAIDLDDDDAAFLQETDAIRYVPAALHQQEKEEEGGLPSPVHIDGLDGIDEFPVTRRPPSHGSGGQPPHVAPAEQRSNVGSKFDEAHAAGERNATPFRDETASSASSPRSRGPVVVGKNPPPNPRYQTGATSIPLERFSADVESAMASIGVRASPPGIPPPPALGSSGAAAAVMAPTVGRWESTAAALGQLTPVAGFTAPSHPTWDVPISNAVLSPLDPPPQPPAVVSDRQRLAAVRVDRPTRERAAKALDLDAEFKLFLEAEAIAETKPLSIDARRGVILDPQGSSWATSSSPNANELHPAVTERLGTLSKLQREAVSSAVTVLPIELSLQGAAEGGGKRRHGGPLDDADGGRISDDDWTGQSASLVMGTTAYRLQEVQRRENIALTSPLSSLSTYLAKGGAADGGDPREVARQVLLQQAHAVEGGSSYDGTSIAASALRCVSLDALNSGLLHFGSSSHVQEMRDARSKFASLTGRSRAEASPAGDGLSSYAPSVRGSANPFGAHPVAADLFDGDLWTYLTPNERKLATLWYDDVKRIDARVAALRRVSHHDQEEEDNPRVTSPRRAEALWTSPATPPHAVDSPAPQHVSSELIATRQHIQRSRDEHLKLCDVAWQYFVCKLDAGEATDSLVTTLFVH